MTVNLGLFLVHRHSDWCISDVDCAGGRVAWSSEEAIRSSDGGL